MTVFLHVLLACNAAWKIVPDHLSKEDRQIFYLNILPENTLKKKKAFFET